MWNALEVKVNLHICSYAAFTNFGWQCPWDTAEYAVMKSKNLFPSVSYINGPSPFSNTTGCVCSTWAPHCSSKSIAAKAF